MGCLIVSVIQGTANVGPFQFYIGSWASRFYCCFRANSMAVRAAIPKNVSMKISMGEFIWKFIISPSSIPYSHDRSAPYPRLQATTCAQSEPLPSPQVSSMSLMCQVHMHACSAGPRRDLGGSDVEADWPSRSLSGF
jgi:hypothetical protein